MLLYSNMLGPDYSFNTLRQEIDELREYEQSVNPLVRYTAQQIAVGIEWWLAEEVISSGQDHNAFMDDYARFRGHFEDAEPQPINVLNTKWISHHGRLIEFTKQFAEKPDDQEVLARQIFCLFINVSGAVRAQARFSATDQESYYEKRGGKDRAGVDVLDTVTERVFWNRFGIQPWPQDKKVALEDLIKRTLAVNELSLECVEFMIQRGPLDLEKEKSETVTMAEIVEAMWLELAVDYILYAGIQNDLPFGTVELTPVWEPKSITSNPAIIYPFSSSR